MNNRTLIFLAMIVGIPIGVIVARLDNHNSDELTSLGIVEDVDVVPTSFLEPQQTQIKTNVIFLVVDGTPPIAIGDTLFGEVVGGSIKYIRGVNHVPYKIHY